MQCFVIMHAVTSSAASPVIQSNTSSTTVVEDTPLQFTCRVQYNGSNAMSLVMTWTDSNGYQLENNSTVNDSTQFQSSIVVIATSSISFPLRCTVTFRAPTYSTVPDAAQATNAPTHSQSAVSMAYTVTGLSARFMSLAC